ncbi:hypothetical protein [Neoroseomonas oryzicola]|uniref:Uncharacterized protein n=1 Tax=Neoroseomonas oryzicola TaxID=535904 RepID=A0A9X9WEK8_9PROT|nr:hypothetical protein [Neoroseomonas oryzicola]MBR0658768.1 hypothetical protein [Neoroseomonas oryzicola]NKE17246.1 hypothetical protein [Neoroseomonas oryzicola]
MLEILAFVCGVILIVWMPIEAGRVAGGWVRPRHRGTPEEFRRNHRRQQTLFIWLGVVLGLANLALALLLDEDRSRSLVKVALGAVWIGVGISAWFARRRVDAAAR